MILEYAPGTELTVDGYRYLVEETSSLHEVDFRMDLLRLVGVTPAHERWLVAVQTEPHLMLLQRLEQHWLTPLGNGLAHNGELYMELHRGSAHRVRRVRSGGRSKTRVDYALFRANSGRVILTVSSGEQVEAWSGVTLAPGGVQASGRAL